MTKQLKDFIEQYENLSEKHGNLTTVHESLRPPVEHPVNYYGKIVVQRPIGGQRTISMDADLLRDAVEIMLVRVEDELEPLKQKLVAVGMLMK